MNAFLDQMIRQRLIEDSQAIALDRVLEGAVKPALLDKRPLSRRKMADLLRRSTGVVGGMLDDLSQRYSHLKPVARWTSILARVLWSLVEAAVPSSLFGLFFRHWYSLVLLFGGFLVVVGFFIKQLSGPGWIVFGVTAILGVIAIALRNWMLGTPRFKGIAPKLNTSIVMVTFLVALLVVFAVQLSPVLGYVTGQLALQSAIVALFVVGAGFVIVGSIAWITKSILRKRRIPTWLATSGRAIRGTAVAVVLVFGMALSGIALYRTFIFDKPWQARDVMAARLLLVNQRNTIREDMSLKAGQPESASAKTTQPSRSTLQERLENFVRFVWRRGRKSPSDKSE